MRINFNVIFSLCRMRNGVEIKDGAKYKITRTDDGYCCLTVMDINPAEDAGDYLLNISNPGGNLKCTATLDIEGTLNLLPVMYKCLRRLRYNSWSLFISSWRSTSSTNLWRTLEDWLWWDFCQIPMQNLFCCRIQSGLVSLIQSVERMHDSKGLIFLWRLRNGEEISNSEKYQISTEEGVCCLTVNNVDAASDKGDYVLNISSKGGNLKCTATLDIEREFYCPFPIWHADYFAAFLQTCWCVLSSVPEERPPAPTFEQPLQISIDGNAAKFECKLIATEDTTITWLAKSLLSKIQDIPISISIVSIITKEYFNLL